MKKLVVSICALSAVLLTGCATQPVTPMKSNTAVVTTNVDNRQRVSDAELTQRVNSAYMQRKFFASNDVNSWPVHVETKDGVVWLTGTVTSKHDARHLVRTAKSVDGVSHVKAKLRVARA
jgi:hyperosmotically inducible protein